MGDVFGVDETYPQIWLFAREYGLVPLIVCVRTETESETEPEPNSEPDSEPGSEPNLEPESEHKHAGYCARGLSSC